MRVIDAAPDNLVVTTCQSDTSTYILIVQLDVLLGERICILLRVDDGIWRI